ncbi:glucose/ribitol dehydrogenase [Artemisia annua]|uniref:Glucose/ribitol dehydrogenase n=1 Tax=Artemisia annua TaxID=35608 RepID=A0A2U1LHE7_ARTAN|nr:glucose/ribitol dehydrogenase [Artemisia annua]
MSCCCAGCGGGDIAAAACRSLKLRLTPSHVPALFSARALRKVTVMLLDARFSPTTTTSIHLRKQIKEPLGLEGKVALITGGASGIGECTAKLFAEHGAKIIIADIQDQLGQAVCEAIGSSDSIYAHCDVTKEEDVINAIDIAVATYGKLDIMLNNAGIMDAYKARVIDNEKTDFERVLSVNITGAFLGMKHAARVMVPARGGSIISMASIASNIGGMATHAYTCAKHAMVGLTKNLAVELGQFGIRVNCLSPYAVATPLATSYLGLDEETLEKKMHSIGNLKGVMLKTDDVAKAALFLASDEAKYISGHNLFIDGGISIVNPSFSMFQYPDNLS